MIWSVPREWSGETCAILAGGPSLRDFDASVLRNVRVITINDSWRLAPWADAMYFCDQRWWCLQQSSRTAWKDRYVETVKAGGWVTISKGFETHDYVRHLTRGAALGLETNPKLLATGNNSGFQAINLAYHFGASKIVLLGYDMKVAGKRTHWHDEERAPAANFQSHCERHFLPCFQSLVRPLRDAGVEVINATPGSALTLWPNLPLEEALGHPKTPLASPVAALGEVGVGETYPLFSELA